MTRREWILAIIGAVLWVAALTAAVLVADLPPCWPECTP